MFLAFALSSAMLAQQPAPSVDRVAEAIEIERVAAPGCLAELRGGDPGQACWVYAGAAERLRLVASKDAYKQSSAEQIKTMWRQRLSIRYSREYGSAGAATFGPVKSY
jgi:hypothetical protein